MLWIKFIFAKISAYLEVLHRGWLSRIYRANLAKCPESYERLKFKLAASEIFKGENTVYYLYYYKSTQNNKLKCVIYFVGKKSMYPESLRLDFNFDRAGIIQKLINSDLDVTNPKTNYHVGFCLGILI